MKNLNLKELHNSELIELYKTNNTIKLKDELIFRAKNQKPFIYSDGTPANIDLINFVQTL